MTTPIMATIENLPVEVMVSIFSRLPRDSLLRSKSVCKSWYALISHHPFLQFTCILLNRLTTMNSGRLTNLFSILKFPFLAPLDVSVDDLTLSFSHELKIHGHSHGLVCLADHRNIFLYNPTTLEFHKLPPPLPSELDDDSYTDLNFVGFGYDVNSKDFKVLRSLHCMPGLGYFDYNILQVYNLSTDTWRPLESPVCGEVFWAPSFEMFNQGFYYWWASKEEATTIIQSFDISSEVFGEISLPEVSEPSYINMGVLNGSTVLFHYPPGLSEKSFHIWEMCKDGCGAVSWSILMTVGPVSGIERPLLFVTSDELLMEANEGKIILYNIKTQHIKALPIEGHPNRFEATFLVESLYSTHQ